MKTSFILATIAVASTASAYQCPDTSAVNSACRSISVSPLICSNPNVNVDSCNAKQCNQAYIDNYAACQCRRSATGFYESSVNVQGLLKRCGMDSLTNPYGSPLQYRPGQGTQTFSPSGSGGAEATRIYNGTTYFGGETGVVSGTTHILSATAIANGTMILPGTTTWVSDTPGIIQGTSTYWLTRTAAPISIPTATPVPVDTTSYHISGGAVAGIVLGLVGSAILAALLGICWRKHRKEHTAVYPSIINEPGRGPTRTVVTEKIEPVVVRSVPTTGAATSSGYNTGGGPTIGATPTNYHTGATNTTPVVNTYNTAHPTTAQPTTTSYNTTTGNAYDTTTAASGYNTQPRVAGAISNTAQHAADGLQNATH
ncbi:hypothetical protein BGZ58_010770 [Dissophora ornata]|nr:hypothetical protein BGZ58_010770 [Dissophora ornata]